jgi:hypothetical protein
MKLNRLRRKLRRQAKKGIRAGTLSKEKYRAALKVAADDDSLRKLRDKIEDAHADDLALAQGPLLDFIKNIWEWLKQNWPLVFDFVMTIAPLLLLDEDDE